MPAKMDKKWFHIEIERPNKVPTYVHSQKTIDGELYHVITEYDENHTLVNETLVKHSVKVTKPHPYYIEPRVLKDTCDGLHPPIFTRENYQRTVIGENDFTVEGWLFPLKKKDNEEK